MQQRPLSIPPESIRPGATVIAGKYRIEGMLGAGAMGTVWTATHLNLGSTVAVKLVSADFARSDETRSRFLAEAKAAATLRSRYVVQMYDSGVTDDGVPYLVMEYLNGESLEERISRRGRLPLEQVVKIIGQVAKGLERAHKHNIVHRDLKPANIFLAMTEDGDEVAKILDFGIAKMEHEDRDYKATATGVIMGTPLFMSPEQARGLKTVNSTSDLYSLGMVAYAALVGDVPFQSESFGDLVYMICTKDFPPLKEAAPWLPHTLDGWFRCACNKDQTLRYASAELMYQALLVSAQLSRPGPNLSALSDSLMASVDSESQHASSGAFAGASRLSAEVTGASTLPFTDSVSGLHHAYDSRGSSPGGTLSAADALAAGTESGTRPRPAQDASTHDGVLAADVSSTRVPKHGLRLPALLGALAALAVASIAAVVWWGRSADTATDTASLAPSSSIPSAALPSAVDLAAAPRVTPSPDTAAGNPAQGAGVAATNTTPSAVAASQATAPAEGNTAAAVVTSKKPKAPRPKTASKPPGTSSPKPTAKPTSAKPKTGSGVDLGF